MMIKNMFELGKYCVYKNICLEIFLTIIMIFIMYIFLR